MPKGYQPSLKADLYKHEYQGLISSRLGGHGNINSLSRYVKGNKRRCTKRINMEHNLRSILAYFVFLLKRRYGGLY